VQTHINLAFADGDYRFALGLEQIHELQTKCKVGIGGLYARVVQGRMTDDNSVGHPAFAAYHIDDLVETVRQGLIGGGEGIVDGADVKVGTLRANDLVTNYLMAMPLVEQWNLAAAILYAKVEGYVPVEPVAAGAKKKAVKTASSTTPAP
jgi:Phage tail tube protein, GTA-gp10